MSSAKQRKREREYAKQMELIRSAMPPDRVISKLTRRQKLRLRKFVKESTKMFDSSHNHEHAEKVLENTLAIARSTLDSDGYMVPYEEDVLMSAALLHDVRDHKYPHISISLDELTQFLIQFVGFHNMARVMDIIDNVSYSKQVAGKLKKLPEPDARYRDYVSDADKIEALGSVGIQRCETLVRERNGKVPEDVVQHCHDKLLRLLPEGFIVTEAGRKLAAAGHAVIQEYVDFHSAASSVGGE